MNDQKAFIYILFNKKQLGGSVLIRKNIKKSIDSDFIIRCNKCGEIVPDDYESKLKHWEECASLEDPECIVFSVEKKETN